MARVTQHNARVEFEPKVSLENVAVDEDADPRRGFGAPLFRTNSQIWLFATARINVVVTRIEWINGISTVSIYYLAILRRISWERRPC